MSRTQLCGIERFIDGSHVRSILQFNCYLKCTQDASSRLGNAIRMALKE